MMQMTTDPFQGNVKALQGKEWRGVFRQRIGDYRLLFSASREQGTVTVGAASRHFPSAVCEI
jgi:mRNA-degrading endonuclease RelE of RelBE toxin-antitoxin system